MHPKELKDFLFVVPKNRLTASGELEPNDVTTVADFQKMGQRGYATTHLGFGDTDDCQGYLVGEPNKGLHYMFLMMNAARIAVGLGSSAIASAAYYASLQYANERPQGRKLTSDGTKDINDKQALIVEHPDVRRMLMLQKSVVEGSMSLVMLASKYYDLENTATSPEEKKKYNTLLEMIIPVVKPIPQKQVLIPSITDFKFLVVMASVPTLFYNCTTAISVFLPSMKERREFNRKTF